MGGRAIGCLALFEVQVTTRCEDGSLVVLRNCPFDALVTRHRALTCAMNMALLEGIRSGSARPIDLREQ